MDILDDSLGMLSTVALLDSEMSDVNTSAGTSVQERLAGMKITSHHGTRVYYDIHVHVACFIGEQPLDICLSGSYLRKFLPIYYTKLSIVETTVLFSEVLKLDHWFTLHSPPPSTSLDASFSSHDEDVPRTVYMESSVAAAVGPSPSRKSHTPHILKRDRRRHRKQVNLSYHSHIAIKNLAFWSDKFISSLRYLRLANE